MGWTEGTFKELQYDLQRTKNNTECDYILKKWFDENLGGKSNWQYMSFIGLSNKDCISLYPPNRN